MRVPNHTHYQPCGQALFGGVHGFDSYFPAPVGRLPTSYDTSFALTVGGGLDIFEIHPPLERSEWVRKRSADLLIVGAARLQALSRLELYHILTVRNRPQLRNALHVYDV
jgi:hypothetical protein